MLEHVYITGHGILALFFLNQKSKSFINFISVAVVAQRMAFGTSINHAFAPTGGVTSTLQSKKIFLGVIFNRTTVEEFLH